jgi:short-subunit dehydrogenase
VNLLAVVDLTHRLLPGMLVRDRGGVLNVASLSGYQGTPFQGTYGGTKAFLLQWSNALHMEVAHTHVAITALCPGVTDTEFFEAAGYRHLGRFMERRMPSARVARAGLAALSRGRMEVVPGALNKAVVAVQRLVPRRFTVAMARRILGGRVRAPRRSPGRASR